MDSMVSTELARQGRSKTWLAQQLGTSRENLYRILRNDNISIQTTIRLGQILNINFVEFIGKQINENSLKNK